MLSSQQKYSTSKEKKNDEFMSPVSADSTIDTKASSQKEESDVCVVCFRKIEIYSVGECDHQVCFECSVRMRCLCRQNECPICRKDLAKVIFSRQFDSYQQLETKVRSGLFDKKYRICFADYYEQNAFFELLIHKCRKCDVVVSSFELLKDHVRKEHEMFYCDICTENLKIFSSERRVYNRQHLALHRRKGDPDDSSQRGHPLCKYCDCRYLDRDELFRHLRREHFFCHFCDADGANQFYSDYPTLRDHFKADHFLCEEGNCEQEQFTAVFRTDIDLKAHRIKHHGSSMAKSTFKQTRTLELEFTLAPRSRSNYQNDGRRYRDSQIDFDGMHCDEVPSQKSQPTGIKIDAQNFPSLDGASTSSISSNLSGLRDISTFIGQSKFKKTTENFPALSPPSALKSSDVTMDADKDCKNKTAYSKMTASSVVKTTANHKSISSASASRQGMVIHVSNRPSSHKNCKTNIKSADEFPALVGLRNRNMYDDLSSGVKLHAMPSKYSELVHTYEPVSSVSLASPKVKLIKKADKKESKPLHKLDVSKLDLVENFPTLGNSQSLTETSVSTPPWVKSVAINNKMREHKGKPVAAAPNLSGGVIDKVTNSKKINNNITNNNMIKPKQNEKGKNKNCSSKYQVAACNNKDEERKKNIKNHNEVNKENSELPTVLLEPAINSNDKSNKQMQVSPLSALTPPPGFTGVTLNSVARNTNNLTFTSSLGENFDIFLQTNCIYIPPMNATKRNQALVKTFQKVLKDNNALKEFKSLSQLFRESKCFANAYYEHVKIALGDDFENIFPELIALLPDIKKQKELFLEHSQHLQNRIQPEKNVKNLLHMCPNCGQILLSSDITSHDELHLLDSNFPQISGNKTNL